MKKQWLYVGALLAGHLSGSASVAEEAKPNVVPEKSIEERVEALEKNLGLKVGFLLQTQYVHNVYPDGVVAQTDLFLGKRAEVKFSGDLKEERILGVLVYDPTQSASKQLKDYYIRFSKVPGFEFQFGQGKYPQALEARTPSGDLDFANRALVSSALGDKRDLFLQVSSAGNRKGDITQDFALALVQGTGQNTGENNAEKDLAGRAGLEWEGLRLGTSGYVGWEPAGHRALAGVETRWVSGDFKAQAEYLLGLLEPGNISNPLPSGSSRPRGYYVSAQVRHEEFRFGARWESYNADTTSGSPFNAQADVLTLEAAWFQSKDRFKLSLDFEEHLDQYRTFIAQTQIYL